MRELRVDGGMPESMADYLIGGFSQDFFRRRIHQDDIKIPVDLDDGIHGTVHQPAEFFFSISDIHLRPQPLKFRCRTGGKNLKQSQIAW